MRRGGLFFIGLLVFFTLLLPVKAFSDETTINMVSRVLETFDPEDRTTEWLAVGSKFTTEGYPKQRYVKSWPEALYGTNRDEKDLEVLGAQIKYDRKGYNFIEFIPVKTDDNGDQVPNPIPIPGRVDKLDLWVWGADFDYYLEAHLQDAHGVVHRLDMGSLDFVGWKNLTTDIPKTIPQSGNYVPYLKQLTLVKLVIWTKPTENVSDYYVYFDQIKVLTDVFESRFDGDQLADPDFVNEMWGGE